MSTGSPALAPPAVVAPEHVALPRASRLAGTRGLAVNGGALIVNVLASGVLGFVFWVAAARLAAPDTVSRASAAVTAIIAVVSLAQQNFVLTLPSLLAVSPEPKRLVRTTYRVALAVTAVAAPVYVVAGPRLAHGLDFLRDWRLGGAFVLVSLVWCVFSLQDAVLTGVRRASIVLGENTLWGALRLVVMGSAWLVGIRLGIGWIIASWAVPATLLVIVVSWYLFASGRSPLARPLGTQVFARRKFLTYMGAEYASSVLGSVVALVSSAYALTALGADDAAAPLVAASLVLVVEGALSSFGQALAVEASRAGADSARRRNLLGVTVLFLGGASILAVVGSWVAGEHVMGILGSDYRAAGGQALGILMLSVPARALTFVSNADNRIRGEGGRNLLQQVVACAVVFGLLFVLRPDTVASICWVLVAMRVAAAAVAAVQLNRGRLRPASA
jgi:O-antigen/teichoic acid export membrane protein